MPHAYSDGVILHSRIKRKNHTGQATNKLQWSFNGTPKERPQVTLLANNFALILQCSADADQHGSVCRSSG